MPGSPKKVSEEELEKQYADYRAQFEQWKENNKSSIGTEAYNQYVNQFEQWEREVEARKAQQIKHRKQASVVDKEAEAAAAYAQSQEAYVTHHLKAMEQAEMQQRAAAAVAAAHQQQAHQQQQHQMMQNMMMRQQQTAEQSGSNESEMFMRAMFDGMMSGQSMGGIGGGGPTPQLWGNNKSIYDGRDPLFQKWGDRAAPTHQKPEIDQQINPVACWLLLDTLREKKMVLAPHSSICPPPIQGPPM